MMVDSQHEHPQELIGAFVVGQLDEREAAGLRAHLEGCPVCRADVAELAPVAAVLPLADPALLDSEPAFPPDRLERRILARVRAERRSRQRGRWLRWSAAGALAAGLAAILWFAVLVPERAPQVPREAIAFSLVQAGVDAQATLVAHTWGTEMNLTATGLQHGRRYTVVLVATDGRRVQAGSFIGTAGQPLKCNVNGALLRKDTAEIVVTGPDQRPVLRAELA